MTEMADIAAFSDALARAPGPAAAFSLYRRAMAELGIDGHDFHRAPRPRRGRVEAGGADFAYSTIPPDLDRAYYERGWFERCPVVALAMGPPRPQLTSEVFAEAGRDSVEAEMWHALLDFGIEHEMNIPLSDESHLRQISFYATGRTAETARSFRRVLPSAHFLASRFIWAYEALMLPPREASGVELTMREIECLRRVACGETNPQIAERLGVSPRTVKFHLTNAMTKLGARSRAEAVARALRLRLFAL